MIAEYKKSLVAEHACIREYTSRPGEHVLLADRYVDPLIIQRHREKKEKEKEIRYRGQDFHHARTYHTDHHITVDKLFSQEDKVYLLPHLTPAYQLVLIGNEVFILGQTLLQVSRYLAFSSLFLVSLLSL